MCSGAPRNRKACPAADKPAEKGDVLLLHMRKILQAVAAVQKTSHSMHISQPSMYDLKLHFALSLHLEEPIHTYQYQQQPPADNSFPLTRGEQADWQQHRLQLAFWPKLSHGLSAGSTESASGIGCCMASRGRTASAVHSPEQAQSAHQSD